MKEMTMKIFTCNNFSGIWPVPTAAVIVANDRDEAEKYLEAELRERKLEQKNKLIIEELDLDERYPYVKILSDGDY